VTSVAAGVLLRARGTTTHLSGSRPPRKERRPAEYFLSDAVEDAFRTAEERKFLANRLRPR
jgi:hypothetical protein